LLAVVCSGLLRQLQRLGSLLELQGLDGAEQRAENAPGSAAVERRLCRADAHIYVRGLPAGRPPPAATLTPRCARPRRAAGDGTPRWCRLSGGVNAPRVSAGVRGSSRSLGGGGGGGGVVRALGALWQPQILRAPPPARLDRRLRLVRAGPAPALRPQHRAQNLEAQRLHVAEPVQRWYRRLLCTPRPPRRPVGFVRKPRGFRARRAGVGAGDLPSEHLAGEAGEGVREQRLQPARLEAVHPSDLEPHPERAVAERQRRLWALQKDLVRAHPPPAALERGGDARHGLPPGQVDLLRPRRPRVGERARRRERRARGAAGDAREVAGGARAAVEGKEDVVQRARSRLAHRARLALP